MNSIKKSTAKFMKITSFKEYLIRILHSSKAYSDVKSIISRYQQQKNGHLFAVEINSVVGFGANLEWCLEIFMHCELYNLTPYIKLTGSNYLNRKLGENYFDYFFEQLQLSEKDKMRIKNSKIHISKVSHINQLGLPEDYDKKLTLNTGHKLIRKYIRIREDIINEVNSFCYSYFGNNVLGIHYRGTDKEGEAPRVDYEKVKRNVQYYLKHNPDTDCVFISSDEINFINYMEEQLPYLSQNISLIYRNDKYRSDNNQKIHGCFWGDNYHKGRDALVNCLILSRCNALMKTASILSGWSKLFNPDLPIIMLNKPSDYCLWFPEKEIARQTLFEAIE